MRTAENLCLHYVSEGPPTRRLTLSTDALAALVRAQRETRRPASLDDYRAATPPGADRFTLSFDDAHVSVIRHALPTLRALDVTATVFVPTAYVGASDDFMSWDDLRRLRDAGWSLGSHTDTHCRMRWRLYDEDEAAHRERLIAEIERTREAMRRELGEAPALFAYPFGEDPAIAREACRAAGVEAAFTVRGELAWDGDPLSIPRRDALEDAVLSEEPTALSVVVPACDRLGILADVVTRLASQSYPEDRYEVIVVDDGSEDDPAPIFAEMPDNVRLVRQGDRAFRAGQARQRGADEARHAHLVFLDADVAVEPDFLWHLDYVHRRVPDAVVLGYLSGYNLHDLGFLHTPRDVIGRDLSTLPILPDRSREPTLRRCLDHLEWLEAPWPLTYTGNLSLPKALLARIGGFGADFVGWGLEDVDLGVRLHRAGARFVFSRFAVGYHVVDPDEGPSRNPFREPTPTRARFDGYLTNLDRLAARHADDPAVTAYVARSREDIDETCGRPMTVGIEVGGAATVRTRYHRRLHAVQPGGVPPMELFDRVAYAEKIGARTIYVLGGAPSEHPAFDALIRRAAEAVSWVSMETPAYPFAAPGRVEAALDAGLRGVVIEIHAFDRDVYEDLHGPGTFDAFVAGLDALAGADLERKAHLVVSPESAPVLDATLAELERRGLPIEEITLLDPSRIAGADALRERLAARIGRPPRRR